MHFLSPPSCGDGIKALLSLFDFQHPPITAGHWLIIVPLQSLGMGFVTPPTAGHPLKVMVTAPLQDPWSQNYLLKPRWPAFSLPELCGFPLIWLFTRLETNLRRAKLERNHLDIAETWIAYKRADISEFAATEAEQCNPSEVRAGGRLSQLHNHLVRTFAHRVSLLTFVNWLTQSWSQTSVGLLRRPWLPDQMRISKAAASGWRWRILNSGRPSMK